MSEMNTKDAEKGPQETVDMGNVESDGHNDGTDIERPSTEKTGRRTSLSTHQSEKDENYAPKLWGAQESEGITRVWSKKWIIICYLSLFFFCYSTSLADQMRYNLVAYVTSDFSEHSLVSTMSIVSSIVLAVAKMPMAKLCDFFGRNSIFVLSVFFYVLGYILMAACQNVQTYAVATVFISLGSTGTGIIIPVFIADTTRLHTRTFYYSTIQFAPYFINFVAGPQAAQAFYKHSTWRWAFGIWAIIIPVMSLPFVLSLGYNVSKARKEGALAPNPTLSLKPKVLALRLLLELDVFGLVLFGVGLSIFLLPFSLAGGIADAWSGSIIAMIVVGFVLLIVFACWEVWGTKYPVLPIKHFKDRTVAGACVTGFFSFLAFYAWDSYFTSFLQVVHNLNISAAGYVAQTYTLMSTAVGILMGLLLPIWPRYKFYCLIGSPLNIMAQGLMIRYRSAAYNAGYQVMPQLLLGIGGGLVQSNLFLSAWSVSPRKDIAAITALIGTITNIGGSVGSAISGGIWTNYQLSRLEKYLPDDYKSQADTIYESLIVQLSYPKGSEVRNAIDSAYEDSQKIMAVAGTCFAGAEFLTIIFLLKDINVKKKTAAEPDMEGRILA